MSAACLPVVPQKDLKLANRVKPHAPLGPKYRAARVLARPARPKSDGARV